jgi:c-di-GMP-binding flagellar brake protein YcgR
MIERRQYQRVPFLCEVTMTPMPAGKAIAARSLDISLGGVGLVTQGTVQPGQMVSLRFLFRDRMQIQVRVDLAGVVANLRAELEGNHVGVRFLEPLTEAKSPQLFAKVQSI